MTRSTIRLGPFNGGLNNVVYGNSGSTTTNQDSIADNELIECTDFEFLSDGSLVSRVPIPQEDLTGIAGIDGRYINILGFFVDDSVPISYLLAEINGNLYRRTGSTRLIIGSTSVWTLVGALGGTATAGIQYINNFYIALSGATGWRWSPTGGLVAVASLPAGNSLQLFKERLWLTGANTAATGSRLYYSNIGTGSTWSGADFIDIDPGNGQALVDCYAGQSALYLFKSGSSYVLTYDSLPARGYIQNISQSIGVIATYCYSIHDNSIYLLHSNAVYRLDGYQFTKISSKVAIGRGSIPALNRQYSVSTVGDRIIIQYLNKNYVYHPLVNAWTEWIEVYCSKWFLVPTSLKIHGYKVYLSTQNDGYAPTESQLSAIRDDHSLVDDWFDEVAVYPKLKTKLYDFGSPEVFKKLHWWGINAIIETSNLHTGVQVSFKMILYSNIGATSSIINLGEKEYTLTDLQDERYFYKGLGGCKFTRVQFYIQFTSSVAYTQGRVSIQNIVASVSEGQSPVAISPT